MKSLRPPIAIAAALALVAPPVGAQPVSLTPPREEAPAAPAETPAPAAQVAEATPTPTATTPEPPAELRGPVGPLPNDLTLATAPPPPPA